MMKKLAMVCLVVMAMAIAGPASAGYMWYVNATDTAGGLSGSDVTLATTATMTAAQGFTTATNAYASEVEFTGALDGTIVKTALNKTYMRTTDPKKFILQANCGPDFTAGTFDFRIWAPIGTTKPAGTWTLTKLYDPIAQAWGRDVVGTIDTTLKTTAGTKAAPWLKVNLPAYATGTPTGATNGYIFEFSVPEPGSMVAMLSGLVGLVGFGIRRRK